jgi:hypothetical protein
MRRTVAWLTGLFHQLAETDIEAIAAFGRAAGGDVLSPDTVRACSRCGRRSGQRLRAD